VSFFFTGRDFGKIERWQNLSLTENVRVERAPQRPTSVRPKIVAPTQTVVTRSTRPPRSTTVRNNPVRNTTRPNSRSKYRKIGCIPILFNQHLNKIYILF
jgi:hypothetical protein